MARGIVTLCYQKVIDASSQGAWERDIFEDTRKEFYMQAQQFDQKGLCHTFSDMLRRIPKADRMHYLVSTAAVGYLRQLNQIIPDIRNLYGNLCLPFTNFRFEIIQSHVTDSSLHSVAIYFYSDPLTWIDMLDKQFIFAVGDHLDALLNGQRIQTDSILLTPRITIATFQERVPLVKIDHGFQLKN